jgi:glycosyltransferase involved in cell wall biosynthesis
MSTPRLGVLSTHPIQYHVPLYRKLALDPRIALKVYYCNDHGVKPTYDAGFGQQVKFDVPLLEGYEHEFLPNIHPNPGIASSRLINPGISRVLLQHERDVMVIHGYSFITAMLGFFGPHGNTKLILRGESHGRRPRPRSVLLARGMYMRALVQRVDHFLAVGTYNADYYLKHGAKPEQITMSPYSVDSAFASGAEINSAERASLRKSFGLPEQGLLVLFVGKFQPLKRPLDVVHAVANTPGVAMGLVGSGELEPQIKQVIEQRALAGRVHCLGFRNQSELPALYQCADVLVLASDQETWGLVVNEAMGSGVVPIVTDQVGCGPDLVDPTCIYPVGDVSALTAILRRMVSDSAWFDRQRRDARHRIASWTLDDAAEGFVAATYKVLGREHELKQSPKNATSASVHR